MKDFNCIWSFLYFIECTHGNHNKKIKRDLEIEAFFEPFEMEQRNRYINWKNRIELLDGAEWSNGDIVNNGSIIIPGGGGPVKESPLDQFSIHPILDLDIGNFFFLIHKFILVYAAHSWFRPTCVFCCYEKGRWKVSAKCMAILGRANL